MNQQPLSSEGVSMKTHVHAVKSTSKHQVVSATGSPAYPPGNLEIPAAASLVILVTMRATAVGMNSTSSKPYFFLTGGPHEMVREPFFDY
jgi:hypothetical protein